MNQYCCRNCGRDITGIEKRPHHVTDIPNTGCYQEDIFPASFMASCANTIECSNCGQMGQWEKGKI